MKFVIYFITCILATCSYASDFINSKYNSVTTSYNLVSDDGLQSSSLGYQVYFKPKKLDMIFDFSASGTEFDEILGNDVSNVNIEAELYTFGLGFLFRHNEMHLIPSLKLGNGDVSLLSSDIADIDYVEFAVTFRSPIGENSVLNIKFGSIDYGNISISSANRNMINSNLNNLSLNQLTSEEFEAYENSRNDNFTILDISIEQQIARNVVFSCGYAMEDFFDNTKLSLAFGFTY